MALCAPLIRGTSAAASEAGTPDTGHWAFQPVARPAIPAISRPERARNPIDRFILAELDRRGWKPAPEAPRSTLLRRAHMGLVGLPPTPAEQERLQADPAPDAFDRVIDDLLARPGYGERWARHWLDVVRYADSNGYERDAEKPFVWRYRDYVIRALNADKPFDRFVLEQVAGDELPDTSAESMIATTFLRLGHWDDEPADPVADRYDQLDDIVSNTSLAFLGLTLGCARCHDHKFEPLSARDYYSMLAVFAPLDRPREGRTERAVPVGTRAELDALRSGGPELPLAYLWQVSQGEVGPTRVLLRGSPDRPGPVVEPGAPEVLAQATPDLMSFGNRPDVRRLGLARWLTDPRHPLVARVIVNRVWQHHFGQGLVRTANDFGRMGEPPSHPELLEWLADWFVHEAGWSLKALHRLILTSDAWRRGSAVDPAARRDDPDNRFLAGRNPRRLDAEGIRDAMLAVSGDLNRMQYGPAMHPPIPAAAVDANTDKQASWTASPPDAAARRTVYAFIKRGLVVPMLEVLDFADTVASCPQRAVTTVAPQALTLYNGDFAMGQARRFAARLEAEAGPGWPERIAWAFRLAVGRTPEPGEMETLLRYCESEATGQADEARGTGGSGPTDADRHAALVQLCRVILNLNEFVYVE